MEYCKLQLGCLIILLYIAFIYLRERRKHTAIAGKNIFDKLLVLSIVSVILDGVTAYTVNHLSAINPLVNTLAHALFLIGLDSVIFALFIYMLLITGAYPKSKAGKLVIFTPFVINIIVVIANIHTLEYINGSITNYSMGVSAYTCFIMVAVYILLSVFVFFNRWDYLESSKKMSIFTYLLVLAAITGVQMIFPETLISSIGITTSILGIYMNSEDPALKRLSYYHSETVMSFATLVENRDSNTGGHIKRTSSYVQLIAEELKSSGYYSNVLTKDYITNLIKAAPMHDIGKIAVPDAVLQKPGKLTDDEFALMKLHSEKGGDIIRETFRNLGNEDYRKMAFEVARYHHEKWNGRGYPDGLSGENIPLCARIMAVADVFDAVSEKRCYRDAMPLDKCFEIIADGQGQDFDPLIAQTFLSIRDKIEKVHSQFSENIN